MPPAITTSTVLRRLTAAARNIAIAVLVGVLFFVSSLLSALSMHLVTGLLPGRT
jgi:hypothetical protein